NLATVDHALAGQVVGLDDESVARHTVLSLRRNTDGGAQTQLSDATTSKVEAAPGKLRSRDGFTVHSHEVIRSNDAVGAGRIVRTSDKDQGEQQKESTHNSLQEKWFGSAPRFGPRRIRL